MRLSILKRRLATAARTDFDGVGSWPMTPLLAGTQSAASVRRTGGTCLKRSGQSRVLARPGRQAIRAPLWPWELENRFSRQGTRPVHHGPGERLRRFYKERLSSRVGGTSWLPRIVQSGMIHFIGAPKRLHRGTRLRYNPWRSAHSPTPTRQRSTRDLSVCAAHRRIDRNSFGS